jgi:hypothetical protein
LEKFQFHVDSKDPMPPQEEEEEEPRQRAYKVQFWVIVYIIDAVLDWYACLAVALNYIDEESIESCLSPTFVNR